MKSPVACARVPYPALRACRVCSTECVGATRVDLRTRHLCACIGCAAQCPLCQKELAGAATGLAVCRAAACECGTDGAVGDRHAADACVRHPIHEVVAALAGVSLAVRRVAADEGGVCGTMIDQRTSCTVNQPAFSGVPPSTVHK
jgi:hypothetical protein